MTLIKLPNENKIYSMDFSALIGARTIFTIEGVSSAASNGSALTIGTPTYSGRFVRVSIGGGAAGATYRVSFRIIDDLGQTHEAIGLLMVKSI